MKPFAHSLIAAATLASSILSANAQAISPMRKVITSYTDTFAIKVNPMNPYPDVVEMSVSVYDENFQLVPARVSPKLLRMGPGSSRPVTVVVPFMGQKTRKIRICAETIPYKNKTTMIRGQVCGKFFAKQAG
jgi:hypothetical protein